MPADPSALLQKLLPSLVEASGSLARRADAGVAWLLRGGATTPAGRRTGQGGEEFLQQGTTSTWRACCVLGLGLLILAGCSAEQPQPEPGLEEVARPPVEASAAVDRAVATTGDLITYTIEIDYDSAYEIDLPESGAEIAGFRIVDVGREDPEHSDGRTIERRWYQLRADLVGSYVLPPVLVAYQKIDPESDPDQETEAAQVVQSSEIFVEVESVLARSEDATDIRGLKDLRRPESEIPWWWIAGGVLSHILGFIGLWYFRRWRKRAAYTPPLPAHEVAFAALDALRDTDWEDPKAVRQFHFAISEVVRSYVEGRFAFNATDLTSEEIFITLNELSCLAADPDRELRRFLLDTDQVKFANQTPIQGEIMNTYERALGFVENTRLMATQEAVAAP